MFQELSKQFEVRDNLQFVMGPKWRCIQIQYIENYWRHPLAYLQLERKQPTFGKFSVLLLLGFLLWEFFLA